MLTSMPSFSHQEQQEAVEQVHRLMAAGMNSSQAIAQVAREIRERRREAHDNPSFMKTQS